jgi:hypothetical protein
MKNYIARYTERLVSNFNEATVELLPFIARTAFVAAVIPLVIGILVQDAGVIVDPLEAAHNLYNWCAAGMIFPLAITGMLVTALAANVAVFTAVTLD